jgi:hypothetical protein
MSEYKNIDLALESVLEIVGAKLTKLDSVSLTALRGAMRQIMSDSYIQGSHDCADSLIGVKK